jgi:protein phosphatase 1 regulatory subunit 7
VADADNPQQANNNMISDFSQVEKQLAGMQSLETVYFEGNPIQKDLGASYRRKIMLALPQVGQIDAT